eukprot:COSAG05_NODE_6678_length_921_cov_10.463504_2_plen_86_part_00
MARRATLNSSSTMSRSELEGGNVHPCTFNGTRRPPPLRPPLPLPPPLPTGEAMFPPTEEGVLAAAAAAAVSALAAQALCRALASE